MHIVNVVIILRFPFLFNTYNCYIDIYVGIDRDSLVVPGIDGKYINEYIRQKETELS